MYQSPIEIITRQMRTQFEDNVFKAIQDYGIVVDKEELLKALQNMTVGNTKRDLLTECLLQSRASG